MNLETRKSLEKRIVRKVVRHLLEAGYQLNVDNGGEEYEMPAFSTNFTQVMSYLMATDDEYLIATKDSRVSCVVSWIHFVYGNDGWDVCADWTTDLDAPVMDEIMVYVESLELRYN